MNKMTTGVTQEAPSEEAASFVAPFTIKKINVERVTRVHNEAAKTYKTEDRFFSIVAIGSWFLIILILVVLTASIIIDPYAHGLRPYRILISVLDFFVITFSIGCGMELVQKR